MQTVTARILLAVLTLIFTGMLNLLIFNVPLLTIIIIVLAFGLFIAVLLEIDQKYGGD